MTERRGLPRVLILGGGFAGIGAARKLRKAPVDVMLVDRHDYHTFQPLLYQVATDILDPATVGHPIRELVHQQDNLDFAQATVTGIDLDARTVTFDDWEPQGYDYLIVGLGARANFFGTAGADEHAFPLYTLPQAVRLKQHLLMRFEEAAKNPALVDEGYLDVVIVGGGATGVETSGALSELFYHVFPEDYPTIDTSRINITLVEHGERLLAMFDQGISDYTLETLTDRNVKVRLGEQVTGIDADGVDLGTGERIAAGTTVWGAGLQPVPLASELGVELVRGRVPVDEFLRLEHHPEVFVVGDMAITTDSTTGVVLAQLGSVALQAGEHVGKTIDRLERKHKDPHPFHYLDKGTMATIGRKAAVAVVPPHHITLTGRAAWAMWGAVHLALLTGGDSRMAAMSNWFWSFTTHDRPARVLIHPDDDD